MKNTCLSIRAIKKDYEKNPLLNGVSFDLHEEETLCLLGPSGSGKSTLLHIIAGLEKADAGSIFWQGKDISTLQVEKRNFGLMFQDYALFPHMTVAENIAFGPRMRGWSKEDIQRRITQTLQIVRMEGFKDRRVLELSGGEKQRVALARTIAPKPELIMLDEPLGALDKTLRDELGQTLHEILSQLRIPTIYVTHDQEEAFTVADSIAVLNFGNILQMGTPEEIYNAPASLWIASFLGFSNQVQGKIKQVEPLLVSSELGDFSLPKNKLDALKKGEPVTQVLKPDLLQIASHENGTNLIHGIIKDSQFRGDGYRLSVATSDNVILRFRDTMRREIGQAITLEIPPEMVLVYPQAHE